MLSNMKEIYLDNGSSTKVHSKVLKVMNEYHIHNYGNASSPHKLGEKSKTALSESRESIAGFVNAKPNEIIFTSGATESNNLVLFGLLGKIKRILISSIEHDSVFEPAQILKNKGIEVIEIKCNDLGFVDLKELENKVRKGDFVSIIHGQNEFGTMQDISLIGEICKKKGALFHTDASQTFGKIKIDVRKMNIDFMSGSAHKIFGPKGIGFIYFKEGLDLNPLIYGGGQEFGIRSGTENIPAIVGFAKAVGLSLKEDWKKVKGVRDYCINEIEKLGGIINGSREKRLANNIHFSLKGIDAEQLVQYLSDKNIFCSTRSACGNINLKENRILKAIGIEKKLEKGSMRIVLSPEN